MTAAAGSEISTEHEEIMIDFACIMKLFVHHIQGKKCLSLKGMEILPQGQSTNRAKLRAAGGGQANGASSLHSGWSAAYGTEKNLYLIVWL